MRFEKYEGKYRVINEKIGGTESVPIVSSEKKRGKNKGIGEGDGEKGG